MFFPKSCSVPHSQDDFHSTGLEGRELKRGELHTVLEECKKCSKTKGLEEREVFAKRVTGIFSEEFPGNNIRSCFRLFQIYILIITTSFITI